MQSNLAIFWMNEAIMWQINDMATEDKNHWLIILGIMKKIHTFHHELKGN